MDRPDGPTLGSQEQLFGSLVVALGAPGPALAHALDRARAAAAAFGAKVEAGDDGTIVTTLAGSGSARDRARQAARCALALRDVLGDWPLAVTTSRAGLVGADGLDVTTAMLRAMPPYTDATRRARPIAIDGTTAGLLDARFEIVGHDGQLGLRRERPGADAEAPRTLLGRPTPFVGREREMATLEAVVRGCLDDATAHAVLLTGPPGVGKSRLRREFVQLVRRRHERIEVWIARGDPMSAGSPLGMLAQVVRTVAGVRDSDTLRTRQAKLSARLSRQLAGDDLTRVTEFLGELADIRFPEAKSAQLRAARRSHVLMGDQMRRAWEDFLAAECAAQPVLLVLEDLHWGDLPTVSFLDGAMRNLRDAPLMILALGQPDVHRLFPQLWSGHALTEMRLGELSRKASERLVREVVGDAIAEPSMARIVAQAAGNAFYLEELIRSVAEGRADLPSTVLVMVQARLASLDPEARRVLRLASVFGATFWRAGVTALLGDDGAERHVGEQLDELVRRELIAHRDNGRFAEEYTFRHGLVRDAVYGALTDADRQAAHHLAGQWLERAGETDAMVLAEQFERGGDRQRAVAWYERAASQALDGNDYRTAIERADRAIACGATPTERGALLALQAEAHRWTGEFDAAATRLDEAAKLLPEGGGRWYEVTSELLAARVRAGATASLAAVDVLADRLMDAAAAPDAHAAQIIAWSRAAVSLVFSGAGALAERLFARIEAAAVDAGDRVLVGRVHQARATRAMAAGDVAGYLDHTMESAQAFDAAGDVRTACVQQNNAGYALAMLGALGEAEAALRKALVAADRMGMTSTAGVARQNLGLVLAYSGALQEARAVEERGIETAHASGDALMTACGHAYLAEILTIGRNYEAAERAARMAVTLVGDRDHEVRAMAQAALARVLLATHRAPEALVAAQKAFALLPVVGSVGAEAPVRLVHAEALRAAGDEGAAREALRVARDRLMERASRIASPAMRASFLGQVPANARTTVLATEWGVD